MSDTTEKELLRRALEQMRTYEQRIAIMSEKLDVFERCSRMVDAHGTGYGMVSGVEPSIAWEIEYYLRPAPDVQVAGTELNRVDQYGAQSAAGRVQSEKMRPSDRRD